LCKNFGVEGKSSSYNIKFNNLSLFEDNELLKEFKKYSLQDSVALLDALLKAQTIYYNKYEVDLAEALSTSTLSLRIFRKHLLSQNIPIIKGKHDDFIRKSYLGGATDYYQGVGEGVYCYDVNSLYPLAMKQGMPGDIIGEYALILRISSVSV